MRASVILMNRIKKGDLFIQKGHLNDKKLFYYKKKNKKIEDNEN